MTSTNLYTGPMAHAAALLDAVARGSEQAVDAEVPLRCGTAANQLYRVVGHSLADIPLVGDDAPTIRAALAEAIDLLRTLPGPALSDTVLDALMHARAAADLAGRSAVR